MTRTKAVVDKKEKKSANSKKKATQKNVFVKPNEQSQVHLSYAMARTERAARAEAKFIWIMPSRDGGRQSQR